MHIFFFFLKQYHAISLKKKIKIKTESLKNVLLSNLINYFQVFNFKIYYTITSIIIFQLHALYNIIYQIFELHIRKLGFNKNQFQ